MSIGEELASVTPPQTQFAGFWRRIGASLIDTLILGTAGWAIGLFFYDQLVAMGQFGRVIGFAIALAYFGVLNSKLGGGASFGKRALGLRVVARDGNEISLLRSVWRAAVLFLPLYLNGFDLTFLSLSAGVLTFVVAIDVLLVFGVVGASVYLYLANWQTRQVMHDLAAGTFVVRKSSGKVGRHIAKIHVVIILIWLALIGSIVPLAAQFGSPAWKTWFGHVFDADYAALSALQSLVNAEPDVLSSGVSVSETTFVSTDKAANTTKYLVVAVTLKRRTDDPENVANRIAAVVLNKSPDIMRKDKLAVTISYGYSIGIWSMWNHYNYAYTPRDWIERIRQNTRPAGQRA